MKLALVVPLVLTVACKANPDDYPVGGGPGGSGVGSGADAATDGNGDAGAQLHGRVCVVSDLRTPTAGCQPDHLLPLKIAVSLGSRTAMTADDGSFTIAAPQGSGFTWIASSGPGTLGETITRSAMPFGTDNTIPAVTVTRYNDLLGGNGSGMLVDQQGSVVMRLIKAGVPASNVVATAPTDALVEPRYDDANNANTWGTNLTDKFGIVWLPTVQIQQPAVLEVVKLSVQGLQVAAPSVPIENQSIMFVTLELP